MSAKKKGKKWVDPQAAKRSIYDSSRRYRIEAVERQASAAIKERGPDAVDTTVGLLVELDRLIEGTPR